MKETTQNKINGLKQMIGNTPLLQIDFEYKGTRRKIYAKAEYMNLTGSIKDRMALHILSKAYENGHLKEGYLIAEATSGNTGIAFSAVGSALGHEVKIFMPNWMSSERINLIKSFGADIHLVSKEEGGFLGSIKMADDMKAENDQVFLPHQFSNDDNPGAHYLTTGPEIWEQMKSVGAEPDAVVAGVGTGGTIMGIGRYLKEQKTDVKLYPMEPESSPTMSTGYQVGAHRIQGISDEFIPEIVKLDQLDDIIKVDDGDGIVMAQMLSQELGLGVGISSGANFIAALKAQELLGGEANVVTLFSDDSKKYLSTDLMRNEPIKDTFLSSNVKLKGVKAIERIR